jgi:DNA-binding transcriptional regulator YiaG
LKAKFARLGLVRDIDRVRSGSTARYVLSAASGFRHTVSVAEILARRHLSLLVAKRIATRLLNGEAVAVEMPKVESRERFEQDLKRYGVAAERRDPPEAVDIKALRERLGLSQEEFALRYGLDVSTLRNWEQGRSTPELAARAFLSVIAHDPEAVERSLAEAT